MKPPRVLALRKAKRAADRIIRISDQPLSQYFPTNQDPFNSSRA